MSSFLFEILRSWDVARLDGVDGAEEDEDHIVDQGHQDREGGHTTRLQSTGSKQLNNVRYPIV